MKIRRYVAKDMRTALAQIKEELGADAVIMSNKKIPEGVELMAAVDYNQQASSAPVTASEEPQELAIDGRAIDNDVVSLGEQAPTQAAMTASSEQPPADSLQALLQRQTSKTNHSAPQHVDIANQSVSSRTPRELDIEAQFKNFTQRLEQGSTTNSQESDALPSSKAQTSTEQSTGHQNNVAANNVSRDAELEQMRQEMASIRQLLEHQVSGLMWQDMAQRDPNKALLVNRLLDMGISEQVAEQVACYVPNNYSEERAWESAKQLLSRQLQTTSNEIIHRGGVVSLVGPTGVGKTTTIAKLAARFAQVHGADQVVMISTDSYRIAGFEQLATYGKIIGCPVKQAKSAQDLDALLQQYGNKKLILIDTAGMGQRDMRLAEHLTTLIANSRVKIRNYLVLAANAQQRVLQENVERFNKIPLAGCIYTKLDESLSIGEIIATSIQNGLPIGYLTDGQRVPEDIKVANAEKLVTLADRLAIKTSGHKFWRSAGHKSTAVV
ncbi:flagellar biosynthesis protein FlhF [Thalassotalea fusca]